MIRIVHFISTSCRSNYLNDIVRFADRKTFKIIVGSLEKEGQLQADMREKGIETFSLNCESRFFYPMAVFKLLRILKKERIDIIQTHLGHASFVGLIAGRLGRLGVCLHTRHHADEVLATGSKIGFWVDRLTSGWLSDAIITTTKEQVQFMHDHEGVNKNKVFLIPYGFDFSQWKTDEKSVNRIRDEFSLQGCFVFTTIARLYKTKGYWCLLRALSRVLKKYPFVRSLIVGYGPLEGALKKEATRLGIGDRVIFTGRRKDVGDILSASDALVHCAITEGFGQVIIEAMAMKKAVISTAVGICPEVIMENQTGFLFPKDNDETLARRMAHFIENPDSCNAMGEKADSLVRKRFDIKDMVCAYEDVYKKLFQKSG